MPSRGARISTADARIFQGALMHVEQLDPKIAALQLTRTGRNVRASLRSHHHANANRM
jgi:hypothetical protein